MALDTDEASSELGSRPRSPTVALVPWGDVFLDFLDGLGVSLGEFRDEFTGSWMFGYATALRTAGVRTLIVCPTARVRSVRRLVHAPTGADLVLLPAMRLYAPLRARALDGRLGGRRDLRSLGRAAAAHVVPYLGTPPRALGKLVHRERCAALVCQEYEDPRFDVCVAVGRTIGVPVFATFQGADYQLSKFERPLRPLSIKCSAGLVIGAREEAERVRRRYGVPDHRLAPILNPLDLEVWRPVDRPRARAELGIPESASIVAWHGQVQVWRKGLDLLLDAWIEIVASRPERDLRLLLVGSGEDAAEVRRRVGRGRLIGVDFVDEWVQDRCRIRTLLGAADVYAFPSRHEGLPVSPLEAMAIGLPVVGADAQGVRDVVGEAGVVIPRGDKRALAQELGALLDDDARRVELGRRARHRIEERFSSRAIGRELRAFLVDRSR